MAKAAKVTTDHDEIRRWVEARGGHPSHVAASGGGDDPGILRIDYPGFSGEQSLEEIDWDAFFNAFDENNLAFLYQDAPNSRFSKFVSRDNAGASGGGSKKSRSGSKKSSASKKASSTKKATSSKKSSSKKASTSKKSSASKKGSSSKKGTSSKKASASKKATSSKKASTSKKSASSKGGAKKSSSKKARGGRR
jgi:hypothetical protein